jgi:hypothetical protein
MSASYNSSTKKWSFSPRSEQGLKPVNYPNTNYYLNVYQTTSRYQNPKMGSGYSTRTSYSANISTSRDPNAYRSGQVTSPTEGDLWNRVGGDVQNIAGQGANSIPEISAAMSNYVNNTAPSVRQQFESAKNNDRINREVIQPFNNEVRQYNAKLPTAENIISRTRGGDYVAQREALKNLGIAGIEDNFKAFYLTEKLTPWNSSQGAQPLAGTFDASYYKSQNPELAAKYADAVKNDDVDIVNQYGENNYYHYHYTTQGKPAGQRGNAPDVTLQANKYTEKTPTDKDFQDARAFQLGIDSDSQTDRLIKVPEIAAQWEKAKNGDSYWQTLGKEKFLDLQKKEEFVALFRLSQRPEDKETAFLNNINIDYGITELEDAINQVVGEKATVDVTKFSALTQNVLKDTIEEIKKAKAKEAEFDLLSGLGSVGEIININKTIADSLLVDSGIGAYASMMGDESFNQDNLEKSLQNITGIQNNVTYNWQQWFDETIKKKYEQEQELAYQRDTPEGSVEEKIKIEAEFARNFITDYLQPRFDQSKSMNEFTEYLDVRQEEKNPFQTEDMVSAVSRLADLRANEYLQNVQNQVKTGRSFDTEFYFNPTGDVAQQALYGKQAEQVASDWENAKNGDDYWAKQAYRFGVDVNDKEAFAKMHFEVKGQGQGFDPAENFLTTSKIKDFIYTKVLPELSDEALKQKNIFGSFLLPEEFADDLLEGLDPNTPEQWQETLKDLNLEGFQGTLDELKEEIMNTVRTGSAEEIRQNIKYLQEKRLKPTQERLGITYIQRDEDNLEKDKKPETEFYQIFKDAGYKGTEEEFYTDVYPDADREDMAVMTQLVTGKGLEFDFGKLTSDPFESLGTVEKLMGSLEDEDDQKTTTDEDEEEEGYFSLGLKDDEDEDYMSSTGKGILGGFTAFLK